MTEKKYTQSVTSTGAGRDGHVKGDGAIDFETRPPKAGGTAEGTNPEALLAATWASCFNGALQNMMKEADIDVDAQKPEVTAHVSFYTLDEGGFRLGAEIEAKFADKAAIDDIDGLLQKTHDFCPVSKALRGDIDLKVSAA